MAKTLDNKVIKKIEQFLKANPNFLRESKNMDCIAKGHKETILSYERGEINYICDRCGELGKHNPTSEEIKKYRKESQEPYMAKAS